MFEFSIRNGNSMIFPFDIDTGRELSDNGLSEHGFTLDLANSQYLTVDVERSVLSPGRRWHVHRRCTFQQTGQRWRYLYRRGNLHHQGREPIHRRGYDEDHLRGFRPYLRALSDTGISIMELNRRIKAGTITFDESEGNTDLGSSADADCGDTTAIGIGTGTG